jgi:ketosteroid isomerase-like protein
MKKLHPNVELVRQAIEAVKMGDFERLKQTISEDTVYRVYRQGGVVTVKGLEGFRQLMETVKDVISVEPLVILADGEYVFVLAKLTGKRKGKVLDTENWYLYRVRDGKLVEGRNLPTDQNAFNEFWS